jgi:chemotaxis protein MotB
MRKKHPEEHENLERWLITYADLITLLLAFFIMMYTFSKQDAQKYQEVAQHLKAIFTGGTGLLAKGSVGASQQVDLPAKSAPGEEIKKKLEHEMDTMTKGEDAQQNMSIFSDERGVVIRIMERTFFDGGKAELKEKAKNTLDRILPVFKDIKNHVMIEGHTDNMPINTPEFKSNWELSVRRATEVVRYLVEKKGFPPQRISATGYAEYRPVAQNTTSDNRSLNRRIEIIVLKMPEKPIKGTP